MKLTPLADRVILKMVEVEETTKGGIILTASAKEKPSVAEVISVGPAATSKPASLSVSYSCGYSLAAYFSANSSSSMVTYIVLR